MRGSNLQARIDKLAVKVTQLDSNVEEVTLQEIQLRKAFRSSQSFDQQVVSRETMPKSMLEQYMACDKPPPLDKLNPYREVALHCSVVTQFRPRPTGPIDAFYSISFKIFHVLQCNVHGTRSPRDTGASEKF